MTEPAGPQVAPTSHRLGAIVFFGVVALLWTVWLGGLVSVASDHELYLWLWCGSAVVLWFMLLGELREPARPALNVALKWWLLTLAGPLGLAYMLYVRNNAASSRPAGPSAPTTAARFAPVASAPLTLVTRVDLLERRVAELQAIVDDLRIGRATAPDRAASPPRPPATAPTPSPVAEEPQQPVREPASAAAATARPAHPAQPAQPAASRGFDWGRTMSTADLMGAKALAFAGGVVTLLGVVFFFVLAVNRGWIGPGMRVAFGGAASAIVFGAGFWLQRRYETTYSALTAVGTGIAGGYATLLAAVSLYDLVSKPVALVIAAAIAGVGVAVSLLWEAEIVAGFGLIGAMIVPATLVFQGSLRELGTAFVAVVFAGATVVAVRQRWWILLQVSALVSVPQALAQVAAADTPHVSIVTLAVVFWLLYLSAGIAFQFRLGPALASSPASFLTGSAVFAGVSAAVLYGRRDGGMQQGIALLVVAAVYGAVAAALYRRARESATLLWALGLALAAVGLAEALSGPSLTYAWAAEAAVLVWLSSRVRDARFQLPALVYLGLAVVHSIATEASPDHLFESVRHPASGAPALLAIVLAALVFARVKRSWEDSQPVSGILRSLEPALSWLRANEAAVNVAMFALAGLATTYAVSLGILELCQDVWPGDGIDTPFEWGHVAVNSVWALAGLVVVVGAVRRRSNVELVLGFGWLAFTVAKLVAFDAVTLAQTRYGISFLVVGAAVLLAGLVRQFSLPGSLTGESVGSLLVSLALLLAGLLVLVPDRVAGADGDGLVVLGVGALYTALAAGAFSRANQRDLSTLLWALGLAVAAVGEEMLLSGVWLVLVYTLTAALLCVVAVAVGERRMQVAALVYLALGALLALGEEAPPSHLVIGRAHPGHGVPSLLLVIGATAVLAWALSWNERHRLQAIWVAGALSVYAASLLILEAMQRISNQGVDTDFQRGHTVVSAFWGLLALVSLYVGLKRRRGVLRVGGFILFAISLGKIFLYDLPSLSSVQRAFSFLAVGAVLLLGGFFYQRLSAQFDER
jgi:uncharacterized membrane protein